MTVRACAVLNSRNCTLTTRSVPSWGNKMPLRVSRSAWWSGLPCAARVWWPNCRTAPRVAFVTGNVRRLPASSVLKLTLWICSPARRVLYSREAQAHTVFLVA